MGRLRIATRADWGEPPAAEPPAAPRGFTPEKPPALAGRRDGAADSTGASARSWRGGWNRCWARLMTAVAAASTVGCRAASDRGESGAALGPDLAAASANGGMQEPRTARFPGRAAGSAMWARRRRVRATGDVNTICQSRALKARSAAAATAAAAATPRESDGRDAPMRKRAMDAAARLSTTHAAAWSGASSLCAGRQAGRQASAQRGQQSIRREAVRDEADRHSTANGSHLPAVDECARQGHSQRSGRAALCKRPKQPPRAQCCAARLRTHGHNTIRFKRGREPRRSDAAFDSLDSVQHLLRRGDVNGGIESRLRSTRSLVSRARRRARSAEHRSIAPRDAMGPVMAAGSRCAASCAHGQRETGRSSQRPGQESKAPRRSPRAERRSWRARRGRADSCGGPLQRPARGCRPCRAQTTRRLLRQSGQSLIFVEHINIFLRLRRCPAPRARAKHPRLASRQLWRPVRSEEITAQQSVAGSRAGDGNAPTCDRRNARRCLRACSARRRDSTAPGRL